MERALKAATPPGLLVAQAWTQAVSVGPHDVTQSKTAKHAPLCAHCEPCEQQVLLRHVFSHASVELNPHCEPLSPPLRPHAAPHGPLRQLPRALSSSLPFGWAVEHAFAHDASLQALMQALRALQSASAEQAVPCAQQDAAKHVWHVLVVNMNPPHVAPPSPPVAPPPQAVLHSLARQPVSVLKSVVPVGFAVRHAWAHASLVHAWTH
jgi:hypothetical protein